MTRSLFWVAAAVVAVAGCAEGPQRSPISRSLDSGVTSSDGGGQAFLHNQPNVGVSNGTATVTGIRNSPTSPCRTNPSLAGC